VLGRGFRAGVFPAPREHIINRTRVFQLHRCFGKLAPAHFKIRIGARRQHRHDRGKPGDRAVGHRDFDLARGRQGESCRRARHHRFGGDGAKAAREKKGRKRTERSIHAGSDGVGQGRGFCGERGGDTGRPSGSGLVKRVRKCKRVNRGGTPKSGDVRVGSQSASAPPPEKACRQAWRERGIFSSKGVRRGVAADG
jgi:hypothetical protein